MPSASESLKIWKHPADWAKDLSAYPETGRTKNQFQSLRCFDLLSSEKFPLEVSLVENFLLKTTLETL